MGAVTYPSPEVQELLGARFVPLQVDETDPGPAGRELIRRHRLLWTPGLLFLDARGAEIDRTVGFLPPEDFLARGWFVLGKVAYLRRRYEEAEADFREAHRRGRDSELGPEALFWAGIAHYKATGGIQPVLDRQWEDLRSRYPDSGWTRRADVFGVLEVDRAPPGDANPGQDRPAGPKS